MKTNRLGKIAFWVSWPLLFFYLRRSTRTRVIITCHDEMLVVKGWLSNGKWSLPGGGIHANETAVKGAIREVSEETGIQLEPTQLTSLGTAQASTYGLGYRYEGFHAELNEKVPVSPQRFEITEARWLPIAEMSAKNAEIPTLSVLNAWRQRG